MQLEDIPYVKGSKLEALKKLGIHTPLQLLIHFPRSYKDFRFISPLESVFSLPLEKSGKEEILVVAKILRMDRVLLKNRRSFLKITIEDESATAELLAFGQMYLQKSLRLNQKYLISGIFEYQNRSNKIQTSRFHVESPIDEQDMYKASLNYGRIIPIYRLTAGISQKFLRYIIHYTLKHMSAEIEMDTLPPHILEKHKMISRAQAFWNIHFPESPELLTQAQTRFKYSELFQLQLPMALKHHWFIRKKPFVYEPKQNFVQQMILQLPFELTPDQKKVWKEIQTDMYAPTNMHRLLQGDVGSGKTIIALLAILLAAESGVQSAFLAPTEILAKQHFKKFSELLNPFILTMDLLIGDSNQKSKDDIYSRIESGETKIIIGTHAIFSEKVKYHKLGLVIIDEQHRFGVEQRVRLIQKGTNPDILIMSATPIPRTLGFALLGDLDISTIETKPLQRKSIDTFWAEEKDLEKVYDKLRAQLEKGYQGFFVYPLIEESESLALKSLDKEFSYLSEQVFPEYPMAMIHGKMSTEEKFTTMERMLKKEIRILIATTVVEVGIDLPEATFIVIENAHRFGLSTLHQLRGRVGRSHLKSYCYLITPSIESLTEEAQERLKIMRTSQDGFALAEKDLELRGIGNLLGTSQKGHFELKIASLIHDKNLLLAAREDAFEIIQEDPALNQKYKSLHSHFKKFEDEYRDVLFT